MAISLIYILSLVCAPFLPETEGQAAAGVRRARTSLIRTAE